MKVLQINATYGDGSTGTIVKDIQECCAINNIECYVAYSTSSLPECKIVNGYKIGNIVDHKIHALLSRINGCQAYFSHIPTLYLLSYIKKLCPDVVHLHNLHSNYINLNMLLAFLAKHNIATIVTLHDCWYFTGGCFHYTNAKCDKWKDKCGKCPKKMQDTPAYLLDMSNKILKDRYRYFSAIKNLTVVGVSNWITNEAQKSVFQNVNCLTIYNGINIDIFKPTPSNLRKKYGLENKFIILGPASKWLDPINADILSYVSEELEHNMVLVLFGCRDLSIQLPENIKVLGFTRDKMELAQLYSIADVFVNCTREESMSCINVEAQSCGTPVITFSNTGTSETVDDICGFRVETGDVSTLLQKVREIYTGTIRLDVNDLRKWIENNFEKKMNYLQYVNLYKELLNKKSW